MSSQHLWRKRMYAFEEMHPERNGITAFLDMAVQSSPVGFAGRLK